MSEVRLGATSILVRSMFRYRHVGQTQVQELRRKGDNPSLPEYALAQAAQKSLQMGRESIETCSPILICRSQRAPGRRRRPVGLPAVALTRFGCS
jgi:hypothetical protein